MKFQFIILFMFSFLLLNCSKIKNDSKFIEKVNGRYLFNSDEVIEVYFKENELFFKWRGDDQIHPLKVNKNTFFVKEMNEKIQFLTNPDDEQDYIVLLPKDKTKEVEYFIKKMIGDEKVPHEYLKNDEIEKAIAAYAILRKKDSLDLAIKENHLNSKGYKELSNNNYKNAINYFKVNIALYPESPNVYDSLGDAFRKSGDTAQAIINYKKSLELDSSNSRIKRKLNRLENTDKE